MLEKDPGNARAAQALETAYAAAGDHRQQAVALETRASCRPDRQERKALWMQLADLRAGPLAEPELAFVALSRAFRDDPADDALRARIEALAARTGQFEELAALYEDEIDKLPPAPMAAVALVLGRLHEEKLDGPPQAAQWYQRAWSLDPTTSQGGAPGAGAAPPAPRGLARPGRGAAGAGPGGDRRRPGAVPLPARPALRGAAGGARPRRPRPTSRPWRSIRATCRRCRRWSSSTRRPAARPSCSTTWRRSGRW